jgi:hypothetical protein
VKETKRKIIIEAFNEFERYLIKHPLIDKEELLKPYSNSYYEMID